MISRHGWDILGVCYIKRTVGIRRQLFGCVLGMPRPCEHAGAIQVRNVLPCIADVTAQRCCMELMHMLAMYDVAGSEAEEFASFIRMSNVPYLLNKQKEE